MKKVSVLLSIFLCFELHGMDMVKGVFRYAKNQVASQAADASVLDELERETFKLRTKVDQNSIIHQAVLDAKAKNDSRYFSYRIKKCFEMILKDGGSIPDDALKAALPYCAKIIEETDQLTQIILVQLEKNQREVSALPVYQVTNDTVAHHRNSSGLDFENSSNSSSPAVRPFGSSLSPALSQNSLRLDDSKE